MIAALLRRPVATIMAFAALSLLGLVSYFDLPVELVPRLHDARIHVEVTRPASNAATLEREVVLPLEARLARLRGVREVSALTRDSHARLTLGLARDADPRVALQEAHQAAAELAARQPFGTRIEADDRRIDLFSRYVLRLGLRASGEADAVRRLAEDLAPRLSSVNGVAQVWIEGGRRRSLQVRVDDQRCHELRVNPVEVHAALLRWNRRSLLLGDLDQGDRRVPVRIGGRLADEDALRALVVSPLGPVRLGDVAEVRPAWERAESLYRVDGRPAVSLVVFKLDDANLVSLGRELRRRVAELDRELGQRGARLRVEFDAAEYVERELERLRGMALSGFLVALAVLWLFVRRASAVVVLALATPVSLLLGLILLRACGVSLNVFSMLGLAVGVGVLLDNTIVVYENIVRLRQSGLELFEAARKGCDQVLRASLAGTATNIVVFAPILWVDFTDETFRQLFVVLALAVVVPQVTSLLVGVGLVPVLTHQWLRRASPAAAAGQAPRGSEPVPAMFLRLALKSLLRHPLKAGWGVGLVALATVVLALPLVLTHSAEQRLPQDRVDVGVEMPEGATLERAAAVFEEVERWARAQPGVDEVRASIRPRGGLISLTLAQADGDVAARLRRGLNARVEGLPGARFRTDVSLSADGAGEDDGDGAEGAGLFGRGGPRVLVRSSDAQQARRVAQSVAERLRGFDALGGVRLETRDAAPEVRVTPDAEALARHGLGTRDLLLWLAAVRREGWPQQVPLLDAEGRELSLEVISAGAEGRGLEALREASVPAGEARPRLSDLARLEGRAGAPELLRRDRDYTARVDYALKPGAPDRGAALQSLEGRIEAALSGLPRPAGTRVELERGAGGDAWLERAFVPMLLLLFAVLALAYESWTVPWLILLGVPLTLLGGAWGLALSGSGVQDGMALMGLVALLGLAVNPAILMVERMQDYVATRGFRPARAALQGFADGLRPVLMTGATTVAGLVPQALRTGAEHEIWPPFAAVVIGGVLASTLLTLLLMPLGFLLFRRFTGLLHVLGRRAVLTAGAVAALACLWLFGPSALVTSLFWRALLAPALFFAAVAAAWGLRAWREERAPTGGGARPLGRIEVRRLVKVYGWPAPWRREWRLRSAQRERRRALLAERGDVRGLLEPLVALLPVTAGVLWLAGRSRDPFWLAAALAALCALLVAVVRVVASALGAARPGWAATAGRAGRMLAWLLPYAAVVVLHLRAALPSRVSGALLAVVSLVAFGARTSRRVGTGDLGARADGWARAWRSAWRAACRQVFTLGGATPPVPALRGVSLDLQPGLIGLLGPNGAGKSTFMRLLCGVLHPTRGRLRVLAPEGEPLPRARFGFLPQDFGEHERLSAREVLDYYALLHGVRDAQERSARIEHLLEQVGLTERAGESVRAFSGGMRQRLGIARALVHEPEVIVVDEPTVGLDPSERIRFRHLLTRLAERRIVLFSTHVVEDISAACRRVLVLDGGRLLFTGSPEELRQSAAGQVYETAPGAPSPGPGWRVTERRSSEGAGDVLRLVSEGQEASPPTGARAVEPTLEDAYLHLLAQARRGREGGVAA